MTVRVGINGFGRIGRNFFRAAKASGADVEAWETFWIDLFREYEKVCDELMGTRLQEDATIVPVGGSDRRRT